MNKLRDIFTDYLHQNYNPIPPRSKAPEIGEEIGRAIYPQIVKWNLGLDLCITVCKRWASEVLKDPTDSLDDLQTAFDFFQSPANEQRIISKIGHRRMQSPDDGAMVDLVNPNETSSEELFRLADKVEIQGNQCIECSKYIRQLARLRKQRGL